MKGLRKLSAFWVLSGTCMASASPPLKVYVTYLGGSFADTVSGMAVDSSGSQYVAGTTASPDFPLTSTALGVPSEKHSCAFVTKFNPTGTAIEISTCVANLGLLPSDRGLWPSDWMPAGICTWQSIRKRFRDPLSQS
jgi:hypothetical protein